MNKRFEQSTPQLQPPPAPAYSDRQFLHTFIAGALLPLVQSTITAIMAGVATLLILYLMNAIDYIKPILVVSGVTWFGSWIYLERRWLTLTTERVLQVDLTGDGEIGEPEPPSITRIQIDELTGQGHIRQSQFFDLPVSEEKLKPLSRGILAGRPFSEREWAGAGKLMSSHEFRTLRSEMIKRGLLRMANDKDARQGYTLTDKGRALMERFADAPSPIEGEEIA